MSRTARFTLSWNFPDDKGAVLTFDKAAWKVLRDVAKPQGLDAEEVISVVVARLVGPISNYRLRQ
jgi:hypothetical protein